MWIAAIRLDDAVAAAATTPRGEQMNAQQTVYAIGVIRGPLFASGEMEHTNHEAGRPASHLVGVLVAERSGMCRVTGISSYRNCRQEDSERRK